MDIKSALSTQYKAALLMLRQAVERCPDEIWAGRTHPRNPWRIAYHGVFFAHLYLMPSDKVFVRWSNHREGADWLWGESEPMEPNSREDTMAYIDFVIDNVDSFLDALDLSSAESGFDWYKNFPKLDHQILNIRHLQGHVGQLSEILYEHGIDTDWIAKPKPIPQTNS